MFVRLSAALASGALGLGVLAAGPASAADPVVINLIGINDFHGRIDANTLEWAATVDQVRAEGGTANSLMVSAGDNVSASLFASAVQGDLPTIEVLNQIGLDASAAGNHEFDKGYDDLVNRLQPAADFPFLGANVTKADGTPALDPYAIFDVAGVSVAVVGAVTQETPALVSPAGVEGLTFGDPVAGINAAVDDLQALPEAERPDVIVASYHEGAPDGTQTYAQALASSAVFKHLAEDTDADVDAIFMGHTHQKFAYDAPVPGDASRTRPILQTGNYGENVGNIKLTVDPDSGEVLAHSLRNVARIASTPDATLVSLYPDLAPVKSTVDAAIAYAAEVGNQPKGSITGDITTAFKAGVRDDRASESTLGNLVADALLEKVGDTQAGADLALVNPGGLRADLLYAGDTTSNPANTDGVVTYAEANSVLPFVNNLSSVTVTGATLKKIFEQQWQRDAAGNVPSRAYLQLGVSENVRYTYDPTRPEGDRITGLWVDDARVEATESYRVGTFSFLAAGGDNFRAFKEGRAIDTGLVDYEAWIAYLEAHPGIDPDHARRTVAVTGVQSSYPKRGQVSLSVGPLDLTSLGVPATTSLRGSLVGVTGKPVDLGTFTVTGGIATVTFTLPPTIKGSTTLTLVAAPTGTTITVPIKLDPNSR